MTADAQAPELVEGHIATGDKGLKADALGFMSNLVIGVASTAPAYSLAATLGFIVVINGVGVKAPAVLIVSFVPILFVSLGYRYLNKADPDAGTTFAWTTRAFGPWIGWMNGWAIFVADVIVMASLSVIASQYTYLLFDWDHGASSAYWLIIGSVVWIALMTWICYRGIELSAETQMFLLSAEILILAAFSIVAFVKIYNGNALPGLPARQRLVVQPVRPVLQLADPRRAARDLHLLGLGLGGGRQRGVARLGGGTGQGGRALDDPPRADLRRRLDGGHRVRRHEVPRRELRTTSSTRSARRSSARPGTSC